MTAISSLGVTLTARAASETEKIDGAVAVLRPQLREDPRRRVKQLLEYAKKEHRRNFPGLEAEWGVSRPYSQPISMRDCGYHQSRTSK